MRLLSAYLKILKLDLFCTPRAFSNAYRIVHWDPLNVKKSCPKK